MDPFIHEVQHTHNMFFDPATMNWLHRWIWENHYWFIPVVLFIGVVITSVVTMKLYLWWKFDRFESKAQRLIRCKRRF